MMLREIRYGIYVGLGNVTVAPFGPTSFNFHVGPVNVDYARSAVTISVPSGNNKVYTVAELAPSTQFTLSGTGKPTSRNALMGCSA